MIHEIYVCIYNIYIYLYIYILYPQCCMARYIDIGFPGFPAFWISRTSRVEFSCHGTGSVATTCSTASAVYLSQRCDLNRHSGAVVP